MQTVSRNRLESVLNFWTNKRDPENFVIGNEERILANIYGIMIFEKLTDIDASRLTDQQKELLNRDYPKTTQ
jgi:Ni,Fe-hydrogenase III component G